MKSIHISDIPRGAKLKIVKTRDILHPAVSTSEFVTGYRYRGKAVYWNDHNRPHFVERGKTATFTWSEIKK